MSRRRQKWAEQRAQGYGPALQRNLIDAENPQAPVFADLDVAEAMATFAPELAAPLASASDPNVCPKCGHKVVRNMTMHARFCKGLPS